MRPLARTVQISVFLSLFVSSGPLLAQSDDERAAARSAATGGAQALEAGRYQEALDLFRRAEAIIHAPTHLLYIARAQAKLGRLVAAHETYVKIARESLGESAPRAFVEAQAAASLELAALIPRIPTIKVAVEGPASGSDEITLVIDGVNVPTATIGLARPIDPGTHTLQAKTATTTSDVASVLLADGARASVTLVLSPAAPGHPVDAPRAKKTGVNVPAFVALGVGVIGVGLGTVFVFQNRGKRGDANDLCPNDVCPSARRTEIDKLDSDADSAATIAWLGYGVGVVGLGVFAWLMLTNRDAIAPKQKTATIHPYLGLGQTGVRGVF